MNCSFLLYNVILLWPLSDLHIFDTITTVEEYLLCSDKSAQLIEILITCVHAVQVWDGLIYLGH